MAQTPKYRDFNHFLEYRLPNKKKWLLTDEFLTDFKNELDKVFEVGDKETALSFYYYIEGTSGFYKALAIVSEKHNVTKAIYDYARRLDWYHGDQFDGELISLMVDKGIIEEGQDNSFEEDVEIMINNGEARWVLSKRKFKDGWITNKDWEFI